MFTIDPLVPINRFSFSLRNAMDEGRVIQARKALEKNQTQAKQIQSEQDVLLGQNEKYRWLKIIIGVAFVFMVVGAVVVIILSL